MKKLLVGIAVLAVAVLIFGTVSYAYAHDRTPNTPDDSYEPGAMGGYGGHVSGMMGYGHGMMGGDGQEGPMHEAMVAALADALDITPEEIDARHDAGESHWEITAAEGLSNEEIQLLMDGAHDSALEAVLASGWITPEHAEWMEEHMGQMWDGTGEYGGHCGGGGMFNNRNNGRGMDW